MIRGEGLQVLHERMKTMDPDQNEIYKFLGVEQADGIKAKEVYARVNEEVTRRLAILTKTELNDKNLIRAINTKVIPVAACPMNVCRFTKTELTELDQIIKRELRKNNMLGRQSSDERLYMKRRAGGRGLKSLKEVYEETRLRVACYMVTSENMWIKAAWRSETVKESNSIKDEAIGTIKAVRKILDFEGELVILIGKKINGDWKQIWTKVKTCLKKGVEERRREVYYQKEMWSAVYKKQDQQCNLWLEQNITPPKTASIMSMLEQMVETRAWKVTRGLTEDGKCRLCREQKETVEHLLAGCKKIANSEYLTRHNRALVVMAVAWVKEYHLLKKEVKWYKERWTRGHVLENAQAKLVWDFEFNLWKMTTATRPDLMLEDKEKSTYGYVTWHAHRKLTLWKKK